MSAAAKPKLVRPEPQRSGSDPKREPFLRLSDEDRRHLFRTSNGKSQFGAMLMLLRRTLSAPGSPRAAAITYREIAEELAIDESSAIRIMADAAARGLVRSWVTDEAIANGLMKARAGADSRANVWEPLRQDWPNLPGADEIERPAKAAREPKPGPLTIAAGERIKPITIQPEDREITGRVKEGSAPIAWEVYKGNGLVELVAFADPLFDSPEKKARISGADAREQKANTLDNATLSVTSFLQPVFDELFSQPIDSDLARRIAINLADTPFGYFRTIVVKKLKGDRSRIRPGLFVTLAAEACEQYGNVLMRQIKAEQNGHSKEVSSRFQTVFAPWCAKRQLDPSRPESADLFREETGEDVFA